MIKRGGGTVDLQTKIVTFPSNLGSVLKHIVPAGRDSMLVVEVFLNVCDSMGANLVNTVCEGIAPQIERISGGRAGLRILSNLCTQRKAGSSFRIPCDALKVPGFTGSQVARRILEAFVFAASDPFRTATHNKGVMNGMDAVAIATGQDWRAINSSVYSASILSGRYEPVTRYNLEVSEGVEYLVGIIEVPIGVGVKGGATQSNPLYLQNLRMLGNPSWAELAMIIVSVGLAQNFAALKALSLEGIQKGHMRLHARNIAISAGVPKESIEDAVEYMLKKNSVNSDTAREFLLGNKLAFDLINH